MAIYNVSLYFIDFVVGSPLSDRITLLRGKPVVMVTPSLEVTPSIIPLNSSRLDCSPDDSMTPCTTVTICFSFTGPGLDLIDTTCKLMFLLKFTGPGLDLIDTTCKLMKMYFCLCN